MTQKILVIRSSSMGDIFHNLPVAYDIKEAMPDCELDWVVEESFREAAALSPYIDHFVVTAFRRWRKDLFSASVRKEIGEVKRRIFEAHYDAVVDCQGILRSAWVASWSEGVKHGYTFKTIREPLASFFYDVRHNYGREMGPVKRYRAMAAESLGYSVDLEHCVYGLKPTINSPVTVDGSFALIAANTSQTRKLWNRTSWLEVCDWLQRQCGLRSVFCWGNDAERREVESLSGEVENSLVLPKLSIGALASTIQKATICVGLDTGVTHLAAALAIPCVGILTDSPRYLGPSGSAPCVTICHSGVTADEVKRAVGEVLEKCCVQAL